MALERFGFTPTESKAYQALLRLGSATGYAVARELSIARANAYQALEALARRGAARRASSVPVRYSALPPAALVAELERSFRRDLEELGDALRRLPEAARAEKADIAVIETPDALLRAAESACAQARSELLMVTGPWAASLEKALRDAHGRGVAVRAISLGEPSIEGAQLRAVGRDTLREYWGGLPLAVVADRAVAVCGIFGEGGRANGVATAAAGLVPFVRHLLRRELAGGSA